MTKTLEVTLFQSILGDDFKKLPESVRESHQVIDQKILSGTATIIRGESLIAKLVAGVFRFPESGEKVPVTVMKYRTDHGETWLRDFDGQQFRSHLSKSESVGTTVRVFEKFGLMKFELSLPVTENTLRWQVVRGWCLGVPLPKLMLPTSNTREFEQAGKMHFDVELKAPMGFGLLIRYQGWLQAA